jgi:hypothetical protein
MIARRALLAATVAAACTVSAAPAAAKDAPPGWRASAAPDTSTMRVNVRIQRFQLQGRQLVAKGVARAGLRDESGALSTATKPVTFQVRGGGSCRVLTLNLDTLQLTLLGLRVDTSAVNLKITGQRSGGALGQLFCRLARGINLNRRALALSAQRTLNRRIGRKPLNAIGFRANVQPSAQAAQAAPAPGSCQVLDLILGPLNLDLLGLRVDLYGAQTTQPVRVLITADPNGGILGQVFCRLARGESNQPQ